MNENEVIANLANQVQSLNVGEGHVAMHNINKTEGLTAVISVYNQQKPAHLVIQELYEWAEMNDNRGVMSHIEYLENDMDWNSRAGDQSE